MNRATFNDLLAQAGTAAKWAAHTRAAPLFQVGVPRFAPEGKALTEHCRMAMVDGKMAMPFPVVRLLSPLAPTHGWVFARTSRNAKLTLGILHLRRDANTMLEEALWDEEGVRNMVEALAVEDNERELEVKCVYRIWWWDNRRWVLDNAEEVAQQVLGIRQPTGLAINLLMKMVEFCALVNHPKHYVVRATPPAVGRSVQWVQSHSHYLLLDHAQGKALRAGTGQRDFDGTLTRAAHRRRAHQRTYRSARYRKMLGKSVWVRSAWIGPVEWDGADRKIYRVINPQGGKHGTLSE